MSDDEECPTLCLHCGDRYGTTPATHHVEWRTAADVVRDGAEHEADLCADHLEDLLVARRKGSVVMVVAREIGTP